MQGILRAVQQGHKTVRMGSLTRTIADIAPDLDLSFFAGPVVKVDSLQLSEQIGSGGYADVVRGKHEGRDVAVKKLRVSLESSTLSVRNRALAVPPSPAQLFLEFRHELSMQHKVQHANTLHVLAIALDPLAFVRLRFYARCPDQAGARISALHALRRDPRLEQGHHVAVAPQDRPRARPGAASHALCAALHSGFHLTRLAQQPPIAHLDLKSPNVMLASLDPSAPVRHHPRASLTV